MVCILIYNSNILNVLTENALMFTKYTNLSKNTMNIMMKVKWKDESRQKLFNIYNIIRVIDNVYIFF